MNVIFSLCIATVCYILVISTLHHNSEIYASESCKSVARNKNGELTEKRIDWRRWKPRHPLMCSSAIDYYANDLSNVNDMMFHVSKILIPRVSGTHGNRIVREHIVKTMKEDLGYHVELISHEQRVLTSLISSKNIRFQNIVATLNPNAPRRIVLACHYDSKQSPSGFLGATDSAVPCSQLINLAYTLKDDLKRLDGDLTLQFIFFDGEEAFIFWSAFDSLYGSRNVAEVWDAKSFTHCNTEGDYINRMDTMVLLDLIGASAPSFTSLKRSTHSQYNRLIQVENILRRSKSIAQNQPRIFRDEKSFSAQVSDDHVPFQARGVPILHLIVYPFPRVWHKMADNGKAINVNHTESVTKVLRVFIAERLRLHLKTGKCPPNISL